MSNQRYQDRLKKYQGKRVDLLSRENAFMLTPKEEGYWILQEVCEDHIVLESNDYQEMYPLSLIFLRKAKMPKEEAKK
ncbi:hypothetical protein [Candidatus Uabimicrobium sp. HlEnr_7]|uniref:hypothetical protein n=1 Tax=Candidatus Uabimicrobium helgolandensis TaxID=3095367 RepID=UPI003555F1C2